MKIFKSKLILIMLLLSTALFALHENAYAVESVDSPNVITVSGQGIIKVAPNVAEVSLGVVTEAKDAESAQVQNSRLVNEVMKVLKANGVAENDIVTSGYSLHPKYIYEKAKSPQISGYQVRNEIRFTVRNTADVGKIIDDAVRNGANLVQNIRFYMEGNTELKMQALVQAVQEAKSKAEIIAETLGKKIVGVQSASGDWYDSAPPPIHYDKYIDRGASEIAAPINPGMAEVRANAKVSFIIE